MSGEESDNNWKVVWDISIPNTSNNNFKDILSLGPDESLRRYNGGTLFRIFNMKTHQLHSISQVSC